MHKVKKKQEVYKEENKNNLYFSSQTKLLISIFLQPYFFVSLYRLNSF